MSEAAKRLRGVSTVLHTLSCFDGVNFAARSGAPALFSVGLMDDFCPPRTVYAAYNHYAGPKEMRIYPTTNTKAARRIIWWRS